MLAFQSKLEAFSTKFPTPTNKPLYIQEDNKWQDRQEYRTRSPEYRARPPGIQSIEIEIKCLFLQR
jgi:hypothetical protein